MTAVHSFADVEQLIISALPTFLPCRVVTETPSDLAIVLADTPVVRVTRVGGPITIPGFDNPVVDFDCFGIPPSGASTKASGRPAAKALAIAVQSAILYQLPGWPNPYGIVLEVDIRSGPTGLPWENANVWRVGFTAQLVVNSRI